MSLAALAVLNKSVVSRTAEVLYQHFELFTDALRKPHKNCSNHSHLGQRGNTSPLWPSRGTAVAGAHETML